MTTKQLTVTHDKLTTIVTSSWQGVGRPMHLGGVVSGVLRGSVCPEGVLQAQGEVSFVGSVPHCE